VNDESLLYFAYGSNMSTARLAGRAPSASPSGIGYLYGHKLAFHKIGSKDGSGKCDASRTGNPADFLAGVLFRVEPSDRLSLDIHESRGNGYEVRNVTIETASGDDVQAFLYYATNIDPMLRPYHWYKEHVVSGAREHGLPYEYIDRIVSFASIEDPDKERTLTEMSLYLER
jgi:hypothetical protein